MRKPKAAAKKKAVTKRPVTMKAVAKKATAKKAASKKPPAKRAPGKALPPVVSLADFRTDFIETIRRADRDLVCEADGDSPSVVNTGWWDGSYDPYDLAPAYKRYLRDPTALDAIMDGILTRVYSRLPKDGPASEQKTFS